MTAAPRRRSSSSGRWRSSPPIEAYNDHEIGRVIQAVEDMGKLDNTLIIYINGDNGTSAEGGPLGTPNEVAFFNGVNMMPVAEQMKWYDVWGTEQTYNHMSAGWSWAFDTPFTWFKQNASQARRHPPVHGGLLARRTSRTRAASASSSSTSSTSCRPSSRSPASPRPRSVDGIKQAPIEGTSFAYTFDAKNAKAPSRHKTQYFEMMGQWALYHEGWLLSTKVNRAPWEAFGPANPDPLNNQVLELYDLNKDFSQSQDIAAKYPDKVKEMKQDVHRGSEEVSGLPAGRLGGGPHRGAAPEHHRRPHGVRLHAADDRPAAGRFAARCSNASYTITADIEVPEGGAEGMILTSGGRFAGYGFYLLKGKPVFLWNLIDLKRIKWEGPDALTPGKHTLEFDFKYDGLGVGHARLQQHERPRPPRHRHAQGGRQGSAARRCRETLPMILQWDESFDIGSDTLTGVNDEDYKPPFTLTAKLNKLTIKVDRPQLSPEDIKKLENAEAEALDGKPLRHVQPGPQ